VTSFAHIRGQAPLRPHPPAGTSSGDPKSSKEWRRAGPPPRGALGVGRQSGGQVREATDALGVAAAG